MVSDAATIAKKLAARRVKLREPASAEELRQFEHDMGLRLDPFFRSIYSQFNGFYDGDHYIDLWPLKRILEERGDAVERGREIADFMIDADFLMCCLTREAAPIFYRDAPKDLAPTASKFFAKLIAGEDVYP
jgi:hypothetical protein